MFRKTIAFVSAVGLLPCSALAASHREAPLVAIDRTADITDFYAFVSPNAKEKDTLTAIICTDPLLEPANGPNYFPFDDDVLYQILIDNDHDAKPDVSFEFRFDTDVRVRGIPVGFAGVNGGAGPIPPAITALDGPGSEGFSLRQQYSVTMRKGGLSIPLLRPNGGRLIAVPANVGPRTMPKYQTLYDQGAYDVSRGVKVFAGTVDDAFVIDLGAAFDSLNFRVIPAQPGFPSTGSPAVLTPEQDGANFNFVSDDVSGYDVNCIAVQAPTSLIAASGKTPDKTDPLRQIGLWAVTSRAEETIRKPALPIRLDGDAVQVQRMANPLFDELLIPTEVKDFWSRTRPADDRRFVDFVRDPAIIKIGVAAFPALAPLVPAGPREDLVAALLQYGSGPKGPFADLLRVDLSVPPTAVPNRLGGCGGDVGGFPNGRRLLDDVTDCFLRVGFGLLKAKDAAAFPRLGDGVNVNDASFQDKFPYIAPAQNGRNSRHIDPKETPGCGIGGAGPCPVD